MLLLTVLVAAASCSGGSGGHPTGESREGLTLTSDQARILGFENLPDWTQASGNATLSLSSVHEEGSSSLAVSGVTSTQLKSAAFAPFTGGFGSVDIWVENLGTDPSVLGTVTLGLSSVSGQPASATLGQAVLTGALGSFQQYTFAVSCLDQQRGRERGRQLRVHDRRAELHEADGLPD
jgi:hypothetical protein